MKKSIRKSLALILAALEVPEDVDQKLMEGFFQEAPEQAQHLVQIVSKLAAGTIGAASAG